MAIDAGREALLRAIASKTAVVRRLASDVSSYTRELSEHSARRASAPQPPAGADPAEHALRARQLDLAAAETRAARTRCVAQLTPAADGLAADVGRLGEPETAAAALSVLATARAALAACAEQTRESADACALSCA